MQPARLPPEAVVPTYTRIAPVHDVLAVIVEAEARAMMLNWAAVHDGMTVLEVAVGTGLSFQHLLAANPSGWTDAVDRTPAMLQRAEQRARRCGHDRYALQEASAYDLPFPSNRYDVLVNSYMFDLLPVQDFAVVLREFQRVLKPGGRLVLSNMTLGGRWYHQAWETLYRLAPPLLGGCRGVEVAPYLEETGFQHVRRAFVSQWTFPSEVLTGIAP